MHVRRWLMALTLIWALAGCDQPRQVVDIQASPAVPATPAPVPKQPVFALVLKSQTNPFFVDLERGARKAEGELGIRLISSGGSQENYVQEQIQVVEDLITAKVDAIIIAPSDSTLLVPVLKRAQDAGIILINIDNPLNREAVERERLMPLPLVTVDNELASYRVVKSVSEKIAQPTRAALVEGLPGALNSQLRRNGAMRALRENRNIQVVAEENGNWKVDDAYQTARALFRAHPDVRLVVCANDMMALGIAHYIDEHHLKGVQVTGYDALEDTRAEIRAGRIAATLDQKAAEQGYQGVMFAWRALHGEKLPAQYLVDSNVINSSTLDAAGRP